MSIRDYPQGSIFFRCSEGSSQCASRARSEQHHGSSNLLTFLGITQRLGFRILPATWDVDEEIAGEGGTAIISQSLINASTTFAFKRLAFLEHIPSRSAETAIFDALVAEVSILGHESIRRHRNIVSLEGVCWDIHPQSRKAWPVLLFEKTELGDLKKFMALDCGRGLDSISRIGLCAEIATAVSTLHDNDIIHGDINPANVLVFATHPDHYVAKVTDFGYSTALADINDPIIVPHTPFWTAPEWHHRPIDISCAKLMDVYSFGLLSMWLILYNRSDKRSGDFFVDVQRELCRSDLACGLVAQLGDLSDQQRRDLCKFFQVSLAISPHQRCSDFHSLSSLLTPSRSDFPSYLKGVFNLDTSRRVNPPAIQQSLNMIKSPAASCLQISKSIFELYGSHYMVRAYIVACLTQAASQSPTGFSQHAAFQLALCYKIGFGTKRDDEASNRYREQASKSSSELEFEVNQIKYSTRQRFPRNSVYSDALYRGHALPRHGVSRYKEQGLLDEAESHLKAELEDLEHAIGPNHWLLVFLRGNVCHVLSRQDKLSEAQELSQRVVESSSAAFGARHIDTIEAMSLLVGVHLKRKQWSEAEALQKNILNICQTSLQKDHGTTMMSMISLAEIYRNRGLYQESEDLANQVHILSTKHLGVNNPITKLASEALSLTRSDLKHWEELEEVATQDELTTTELQVLPPQQYLSLEDILQAHKRRKHYEGYVLRMLQKKQETLKQDHPLIFQMQMLLASIYKDQQRWEEAEAMASEVLRLRRERTPNHPSTISCMLTLGSIYKFQGRLEEQRVLIEEAIQLSEGNPNIGRDPAVLAHLASNHRLLGRLTEAEQLELEILEIHTTQSGEEHPSTLSCMCNLAQTYMRMGRWKEAGDLASLALTIRQTNLGTHHPLTWIAMGLLGKSRRGQGRLFEAEELASKVIEKKTEAYGKEHWSTLRTMLDLSIVYYAQGRFKEAFESISEVVELSNTVLGSQHPEYIRRKSLLHGWTAER